MESFRIKKRTLIVIALFISFLINLNRFLFIVYPSLSYFDDIAAGSVSVLIFRIITFAGYCFLILYLTTHQPSFLQKVKNPLRSVVFFLVIIISAIGSFYLIMGIHKLLLFEVIEPEREGIRYVWVVQCTVSLLIGWLLLFRKRRKTDILDKERLLKEKAQSELQALNNQINPHFLFNSLNTLKYIIQDNKRDSVEFVDKLASLYRYILQSSQRSLVPLQHELDFISDYIYLIKARYESNFDVHINFNIDKKATMIPILSLQLLLENAIKHNEISSEFPLQVNIYNTPEFIVVENKKQPKTRLMESTNQGLKNLSKRYQLLLNRKMVISDDAIFSVKLPLS